MGTDISINIFISSWVTHTSVPMSFAACITPRKGRQWEGWGFAARGAEQPAPDQALLPGAPQTISAPMGPYEN